MYRREILSILAVGSVGFAGCNSGGESTAKTPPIFAGGNTTVTGESFARPKQPVPDKVSTEVMTDEVQRPIEMAFLPNDGGKYIVERTGRIYFHDSNGLATTPALDLRDQILDFDPQEKYEVGVLGIELHPNFDRNRRLFVRYSSPPRPGTEASEYHHTFVLSEFEVSSDSRDIKKDTERTIMEIAQPEAYHQSGDIIFGPDEYLYVATGDSGQPGDGSVDHPDYVEDWYDVNWGGNSQNTTDTLLGGILRIDVDSSPTEPARTDDDAPEDPSGGHGYAIPPENPLVDWENHRNEYFAWGFRNPWKTTFHGGEYFVADVGEVGREELNHVRAGGNYGWDVREGSLCYYVNEAPENPSDCPESTPPDVRGGEPLIDPIVEYPWWGDAPKDKFGGEAIIGGHFYMGSAIPGLYGRYIFGDITANERFFVATPPRGSLSSEWNTHVIRTEDLHPYRSFSRDNAGEMYILTKEDVRKIIPAR